METSKKVLREKKKEEIMGLLMEFLASRGEEILQYKSNEFAIPIVLENGDEEFVQIVTKIPIGANKGTEPFDGYGEKDSYQMGLKLKAEAKVKADEAKAKKIARDKIAREKKAENAEKHK